MRNQALSGLRVAAWTAVWSARVFYLSQAFPLSGAVFPYEKQATDVICAPRAVDSREVDDIALSHGAIG
jgi:hypothetical protein